MRQIVKSSVAILQRNLGDASMGLTVIFCLAAMAINGSCSTSPSVNQKVGRSDGWSGRDGAGRSWGVVEIGERSPSLPDEVRLCDIARYAAVRPRMALYRAVESRPVMAAGMMPRECAGRKGI
jgi:hypothetical protein